MQSRQLLSTGILAAISFAPLIAASNQHFERHHRHRHYSSNVAASSAGNCVLATSYITASTTVTITVSAPVTSTDAVNSSILGSSYSHHSDFATSATSHVSAVYSHASSSIASAEESLTTTSADHGHGSSSTSTALGKVKSSDIASNVIHIPSSAVFTSVALSSHVAISAVADSSPSTPGSTSLPILSRKSGLSGYVGIADEQAFTDLQPYISWYSDYTPTTPNVGSVKGVGMLWGNGETCTMNDDDSDRMKIYKSDVLDNSTAPEMMFGFYEPDCYCPMSSDMSISDGTQLWNNLIAPLKAKGTILGSPSMCKQKDEDWLTPFSVNSNNETLLDAEWDVTSIHINKNSIDGVKEDVEYYVSTYGKKVFVSEFACVDDKNEFTACTDQDQINQFISDAVDYFEGNDDVIAYGASNGEGLGDVWPLTDSSTGELTATGKTYLNKIKSL